MTFRISISGIVQGVGFRPFVKRYADKYGWKGYVMNMGDHVEIRVNLHQNEAHHQIEEMLAHIPNGASIEQYVMEEQPHQDFSLFTIIESVETVGYNIHICPDKSICENCLKESEKTDDPRYQYGYTTCTDCGPRYSTIRSLPYDRARSTMDDFTMCDRCKKEYQDPQNRRFHSQTNSCPECGVKHRLLDKNGKVISSDQLEILEHIVQAWNENKSASIKGVSGFLLTSAISESAITSIRKIKKRPVKPLAIMVPDIHYFEDRLPSYIADSLTSPESPIVLIPKQYFPTSFQDYGLTYGLQHIGVMLPYTALHHHLLKIYKLPIVATSANISNSPIIYQNENISSLGAEVNLIHNREITVPLDDSVIRINHEHQVLIRRARGYAPTVIKQNDQFDSTLVSFGADLKSTITCSIDSYHVVSEYIGNLQDYDTELRFLESQKHLLNTTRISPTSVVCDAHPGYRSSELARKYALVNNLPLIEVQHHKAHFAAVLGEHNLLERNHILGVIWDGTGYGEDGNIWGGEFFTYENQDISRVGHIQYFPTLSSDKMSQEPRIAALSLSHSLNNKNEAIEQKFSKIEYHIYTKQLSESRLFTSSMGRLFDAVGCILDLGDYNRYEGETAIKLEQLAQKYLDNNPIPKPYGSSISDENEISIEEIIIKIIRDKESGKDTALIASKFHVSLVNIIQSVAAKNQAEAIAVSGGVFQNMLLLSLMKKMISEIPIYLHEKLSPSDDNISYGQAMYHRIKCAQLKSNHKNKELCV